MGRDGVISKRVFAAIDEKRSTPVRSIVLMGAVSLLGALVLRFQLAVELLNFGALAGFILVNVSVVRHYYFTLRLRSGWQTVQNLVFPLFGALACSFVWMSLTNKAKLAGFGWLAVGVIYLAVVTRGFRLAPGALRSLEGNADAG
jgi:amino acid transporter